MSYRCGVFATSADLAAHMAGCDRCDAAGGDPAGEQEWDAWWERTYVPADERGDER